MRLDSICGNEHAIVLRRSTRMFIVTSTDVWADTRGVQTAATMFHGKHVGFGNFVVKVAGKQVFFTRQDGTREGDAIKAQYGFSSRPHIVQGSPEIVGAMLSALEGAGHAVVYEEK